MSELLCNQTLNYLSYQIFQAVPGYLGIPKFKRLLKIRVKYLHTHREIRLVEVIGDVPTNLAVFSSFLYHGVEEAQYEDKRGEGWMRTVGESRVGDLVVGVP